MRFYSILVPLEVLHAHLSDPTWLIVDCRFSLAAHKEGFLSYPQSHILGADYTDLDEDLSGPVMAGQTGRHPLPAAPTAAKTFSRWGINSETHVIVDDDTAGANGSPTPTGRSSGGNFH
jgi:thiosulfate/3-mercaptopyruvate sulfurtransferase